MTRAFPACTKFKSETVRAAIRKRTPFFCVCPAGVREYIVPFFFRNSCAAVLYFDSFHRPGKEAFSLPEAAPRQEKILKQRAEFVLEFLSMEFEALAESGALNGKHRGADVYAENAERYIDSHYSENIGLAALAETLHVNPAYLGEQLKRSRGKSFRRMLTEKRIAESKVYLLRHKSNTIAHIAALCGFRDSNYFSLVFRKITGMTPGEFRRKELPPALENAKA